MEKRLRICNCNKCFTLETRQDSKSRFSLAGGIFVTQFRFNLPVTIASYFMNIFVLNFCCNANTASGRS